jgi:hypothetical protein
MKDGFHVVRTSNRFWTGISTDLAIETHMMKEVKGKSGLTHGRGLSENARTTWVKTVHMCATIHTSMLAVTGLLKSFSTTQHADVSTSRASRDFADIMKIVEWFEANNPFDTFNRSLRSLSNGVSAAENDPVNCDKAEDIGASIMQRMNGLPYSEVSIKKADKVVTLSQIGTVSAPRSKQVNIDATVLFSRLVVIMSRCTDIASYFSFELTALPTSLFKDSFMRKADKAQLKNELIQSVDEIAAVEENCMYVLDGGHLLHKVKWQKAVPYSDIVQQYVDFVRKHYGTNTAVVFDGYCNGPSTKDHEHKRRASTCAPDNVYESNKLAYHDQAAFLANERNKKTINS